MSNPLVQTQQAGSPMQMLQQLQQNPLGILRQRGYNLPDNMSDPRAIIQHLLNSGQVSQQQVNAAQTMARRMGIMR